jgi:CRP-like cAMP-binding protein
MTACDDSVINQDTIKHTPLGEGLTDAQCALLAEVTASCSVKDGTFLIEEGQKDDAIHVLTRGRLEVLTRAGGGTWVTLHLLKEGDMVGEMGFIDGVEHSASLRALGNCDLIRLDRDSFEGLIKKDPELVYQVMRSIMRTVHRILRGMNAQYVELTNYISKQHGRY